jgi:hypothetical protein
MLEYVPSRRLTLHWIVQSQHSERSTKKCVDETRIDKVRDVCYIRESIAVEDKDKIGSAIESN